MKGNQMTHSAKIYAACLASYNAGILHGAWINASDDVEDMQEGITAMLKASPEEGAEEWAIHDHEGLGEISEYVSMKEVADRMKLISAAEEMGIPADVAVEFANDTDAGQEVEEVILTMMDQFAGVGDTWQEFVETMFEETHDMEAIPEAVRYYIDFEAMARDWRLNGEFNLYEANHRTYVFYA